jgi:hypothetical protein
MADMNSQGRSPILEKLLSDGGNDTIAATNWDKNPEGGQNPLEQDKQPIFCMRDNFY